MKGIAKRQSGRRSSAHDQTKDDDTMPPSTEDLHGETPLGAAMTAVGLLKPPAPAPDTDDDLDNPEKRAELDLSDKECDLEIKSALSRDQRRDWRD